MTGHMLYLIGIGSIYDSIKEKLKAAVECNSSAITSVCLFGYGQTYEAAGGHRQRVTILSLLESCIFCRLHMIGTFKGIHIICLSLQKPNFSHRSRNSWVPKELSSTTPPQFVLTIRLRCSCGPMPSFQ